VVDHQPELGGGDGEAGARLGHPQVARDRQLRAGPEHRAVHGGDRRYGHGGERLEGLVERAHEGGVLDAREVGTRAEVRTGAGEDQCAGAPVRSGANDRRQLLAVVVVQCVAPLRAVQHNNGDSAAALDVDHGRSPRRYSSFRTTSMSAETIMATRLANVVAGSQPSAVRALLASPTSSSTSAGRMKRSSMTTWSR